MTVNYFPTEVYKKTFEITSDFDLKVDNFNKIPWIEGEDKIKQDLDILFQIPKGDLMFNEDIGLDIESVLLIGTRSVKQRRIKECLEEYRFYKKVVEIRIDEGTFANDFVETWDVKIELLSGEELTLQAVYRAEE